MRVLPGLCVAAVAVLACVGYGAPEPAIVQGPLDWTLEAAFEHPQQIVLNYSGTTQRYWYMILTVTNRTGDDVAFYPQCDLMTDTFEVLGAREGTSGEMMRRIKERHQGQYPFLESLEEAGNRVLEGEDNTKDIVVVWPDFDPAAKGIKIFISGLSNETVGVDHPVKRGDDGEPVKVFLRKTLELKYSVGGDPAFRDDVRLKYLGKRWVMR